MVGGMCCVETDEEIWAWKEKKNEEEKKKRDEEAKVSATGRVERKMAEWVVYLGAVDRAFVPLVSVDVNASHRPAMLLVIAPLANPRPKFPAAGLSRAGGDHDDLGLGPNPTRNKSFWRCYQGLPGPLQGVYRHSAGSVSGARGICR